MKRLIGKATVIVICMFLSLFITSVASQAAKERLWFSNKQDIGYSRPDWMGQLDDSLFISELSIPGTHETMSHYGGGPTKCHTFRLDQQLKSGIRALDVRMDRRYSDNCTLKIYHGCEYQHALFGPNVLEVCKNFLDEHDSETILMRIKIDQPKWFCPELYNCLESVEEGITPLLNQYSDYIYGWDRSTYGFTGSSNPTLGDVRGKIVILDNITADGHFGIPWGGGLFFIQDWFYMHWSHPSMNTKWGKIKKHFIAANFLPAVFRRFTFVNHTTGSGMINPVDVAYGVWIPFQYCDGMNKRTYRYLRQKLDEGEFWRTGIVMMDFPGAGLIDVIIAHNGLDLITENDAPEADANGPYFSDEGSEIIFDASNSSDADGDTLKYRWDFDNDGSWDTDWSDNPTAGFTWYDDYTGEVQLEVKDEKSATDHDMVAVTVNNLAPMTTIDSIISPVEGCILPGQEVVFVGSFTDPGSEDYHEADWDFGDRDGINWVPGTLTEENEKPDATGSVEDGHTYGEPGLYTVLLEIEDDDGGIGTASIEVEVMTASEAVDFADSFIQELPEYCFKGQADNRKNAFSNKFKAVKNALDVSGIRGAINKLRNDIRAKADGSVDGKSNNDWIADGEAQEKLCLVIDELVKYLESLQNG